VRKYGGTGLKFDSSQKDTTNVAESGLNGTCPNSAILQGERQLSQEGGDQIYIYNLHPRKSLNARYASKSSLSDEE
jgi:hypothetical protein